MGGGILQYGICLLLIFESFNKTNQLNIISKLIKIYNIY